MTLAVLYVTAQSRDEALRIGRVLVEERLVACVNVLGGMRSIYWWKGEIHEDDEAVLIAKTRMDLAQAATARTKELHSYEVPCVVALPLADGNPDFLDWIDHIPASPAHVQADTQLAALTGSVADFPAFGPLKEQLPPTASRALLHRGG